MLFALALLGLGGTAFVAPSAVAGSILGAVGFGTTGILAGSLAAAWHATIGNAVAGSIFAIFQSAGMAGYGAAAVTGAMQAGGGIATAVGGLAAYFA